MPAGLPILANFARFCVSVFACWVYLGHMSVSVLCALRQQRLALNLACRLACKVWPATRGQANRSLPWARTGRARARRSTSRRSTRTGQPVLHDRLHSPPLGASHVLRVALHVNFRGVGLRGRRRRPRPNAGRPYGRVQCLPHRRPTPHTTRWRVRITRWLEAETERRTRQARRAPGRHGAGAWATCCSLASPGGTSTGSSLEKRA